MSYWYRRPPKLNEVLFRRLRATIGVLVAVHLIILAWSGASATRFGSDLGIDHYWPLVLVGSILAVVSLLPLRHLHYFRPARQDEVEDTQGIRYADVGAVKKYEIERYISTAEAVQAQLIAMTADKADKGDISNCVAPSTIKLVISQRLSQTVHDYATGVDVQLSTASTKRLVGGTTKTRSRRAQPCRRSGAWWLESMSNTLSSLMRGRNRQQRPDQPYPAAAVQACAAPPINAGEAQYETDVTVA